MTNPMKIISFIVFTSLALPSLGQYHIVPSNNPIIDSHTKKYSNQRVNIRQLDTIVKELTQDGLFQIVYVEELGNGKVTIRAQQTNRIHSISIEGNSTFSNSEILEKMSIATGSLLSELEIRQAISQIRSHYQDSGFFNFEISYKKERLENGIRLIVNIEERSKGICNHQFRHC